jgi:hypothetical protein
MPRLAALFATLFAAVLTAGCASFLPATDSAPLAHTRAPVQYESTVSSYFDLTGAPLQRKLAFGAPESSDCALHGSGGAHLGWVVPVIYDTSPASNKSGHAGAAGKSAAAKASAQGKADMAHMSASGTGSGAVALEEVSITGTRYFFWFSSETLSAVTRRGDICP